MTTALGAAGRMREQIDDLALAGGFDFPMNGPYSPDGVRSLHPDMLPTMGLAGIPTPEGQPVVASRGARGADWVIAGSTHMAEQASLLIESFTREDYQRGLATSMDQPPTLLGVVADANVIAPYKQMVENFAAPGDRGGRRGGRDRGPHGLGVPGLGRGRGLRVLR